MKKYLIYSVVFPVTIAMLIFTQSCQRPMTGHVVPNTECTPNDPTQRWTFEKKAPSMAERSRKRDFLITDEKLVWCDNETYKGEVRLSNIASIEKIGGGDNYLLLITYKQIRGNRMNLHLKPVPLPKNVIAPDKDDFFETIYALKSKKYIKEKGKDPASLGTKESLVLIKGFNGEAELKINRPTNSSPARQSLWREITKNPETLARDLSLTRDLRGLGEITIGDQSLNLIRTSSPLQIFTTIKEKLITFLETQPQSKKSTICGKNPCAAQPNNQYQKLKQTHPSTLGQFNAAEILYTATESMRRIPFEMAQGLPEFTPLLAESGRTAGLPGWMLTGRQSIKTHITKDKKNPRVLILNTINQLYYTPVHKQLVPHLRENNSIVEKSLITQCKTTFELDTGNVKIFEFSFSVTNHLNNKKQPKKGNTLRKEWTPPTLPLFL